MSYGPLIHNRLMLQSLEHTFLLLQWKTLIQYQLPVTPLLLPPLRWLTMALKILFIQTLSPGPKMLLNLQLTQLLMTFPWQLQCQLTFMLEVLHLVLLYLLEVLQRLLPQHLWLILSQRMFKWQCLQVSLHKSPLWHAWFKLSHFFHSCGDLWAV